MPLRLAHTWWGIGALLVAAVVVFSLLPPGEGPPLVSDKLVHFTSYFVLAAWFTSLAVRRQWTALVAVVALGALIEILQGFTPERQPEWLDLLANTAGAVLALLAVRQLPFNIFVAAERVVLK